MRMRSQGLKLLSYRNLVAAMCATGAASIIVMNLCYASVCSVVACQNHSTANNKPNELHKRNQKSHGCNTQQLIGMFEKFASAHESFGEHCAGANSYACYIARSTVGCIHAQLLLVSQ